MAKLPTYDAVAIHKLEAAHQKIVDIYLANAGTTLSGEVCNEMAAISKRTLDTDKDYSVIISSDSAFSDCLPTRSDKP